VTSQLGGMQVGARWGAIVGERGGPKRGQAWRGGFRFGGGESSMLFGSSRGGDATLVVVLLKWHSEATKGEGGRHDVEKCGEWLFVEGPRRGKSGRGGEGCYVQKTD